MSSKVDPASGTPAKKSWGIKKFFKRIYRLISSHVGLLILLVLYSFAGAAIFEKLEGDHEIEEKADILDLRDDIIDTIWNASFATKRNEPAFKQLMRQELRKYETELYGAFAHGISSESEDTIWDFWGSMFYCATIYTTIGKQGCV